MGSLFRYDEAVSIPLSRADFHIDCDLFVSSRIRIHVCDECRCNSDSVGKLLNRGTVCHLLSADAAI